MQSRRNFLKSVGLAGGAVAAASFLPAFTGNDRAFAQGSGLNGTVLITLAGPVRIHTYVAPADSVLVTSHIIETENSLVLVDTQFAEPYANEVKSYIEATGKPLDRVYLSHQHQDHWSGGQLYDVPFITTDAIAAGVEEEIAAGDGGFGTPVAPEGGVTAGTETIDGVTFEFDIINDAEAPEHLLIKLPEAGAIIVQDLAYSDAHAFPLGNNENWITVLDSLRPLAEDGYSLMLNGHGLPSGFGQIDQSIEYLNVLSETLASASSGDDVVAALVERYPSYDGAFILSFAGALFQ